MTKKELIALLHEDLLRERMHLAFYSYAASKVEGPSRAEMKEFFTEQAESELKHVLQFQDLILGLGGDLEVGVVKGHPAVSGDVRELLQYALKMEDKVVVNYAQRLAQADSLGSVDGVYVSLFLEDQLMDSREDADNIRMMLKRLV